MLSFHETCEINKQRIKSTQNNKHYVKHAVNV